MATAPVEHRAGGTAIDVNLIAAEELARQLHREISRSVSIVVDFIDMHD